jgi:hypothetical protein
MAQPLQQELGRYPLSPHKQAIEIKEASRILPCLSNDHRKTPVKKVAQLLLNVKQAEATVS